MRDSDGCGTGISQPCTTEPNNGSPWLLSIHENPEMLHSWSNMCGSIPTPDSLGTASANGLYTKEMWISDKKSPAPTPKAELEISVLISSTGLSAQPESVYSNNSRSVRNISHPCFYSSPASLCTWFLSNRELVPKVSNHLCGVMSTLATLCCI